MELSEKKIEVLRKSVNQVGHFISTLCDIREDRYETLRSQWLEEVEKTKGNLESDLMLLFIGPYSSGKSSFVNALLGVKELLPTSARPCTTIVTELSFKRGGDLDGKAFFLDQESEPETMPFEELKKLIDGPRGTAVGALGQYDHIELIYDVSELDDIHPLNRLEKLNVKIVDCPGYGSIYVTNEAVIERYIERANFTFWMTPADKFGGTAAERRLSEIKRKTTTLIPVITKSDLIDEAQREQAVDDFYEHLGHLFRSREPLFVSALKFNEASELSKTLSPDNPNKEVQLSKAERETIQQKIDVLRAESGVEQVFTDMIVTSQKKVLNETNLIAAMHDLSNLLKAISQAVIREEKHWLGELQKAGWSSDDRYKKLNETKNNVEAWIKVESERVATNLEALILKALLDYIMKAHGKGNSGAVKGIVREIWNDELLRNKDDWAQRFADEYSKGSTREVLSIVSEVSVFVAIPLVPFIFKTIKERKQQYQNEIEGRLREWIREINLAPAIAVILQNQNEKLYRHYRDEMDKDLLPLLNSYELCGKIKEGMVELNDILSFNFPEYFSKG